MKVERIGKAELGYVPVSRRSMESHTLTYTTGCYRQREPLTAPGSDQGEGGPYFLRPRSHQGVLNFCDRDILFHGRGNKSD